MRSEETSSDELLGMVFPDPKKEHKEEAFLFLTLGMVVYMCCLDLGRDHN